ncbi:MAG: flagellar basal body-associated FliL family protein [Spirochaetales bacterium]|nr:flagellar basal body-associated FliL family protein [Spirochaetales bacterium]
MGDEEQYIEDEREGTEEIATGKREGFFKTFLKQALKYIIIFVAIVILVVTVSIITYRLLMGGRMPESPHSQSPAYVDPHTKYQFFNSLRLIRGATADDPPRTFSAEISLGYQMGRTRVQSELIERKDRIENLIFLFLGQKKASELTSRDAEELQGQIKNKINSIMVEKIDLVLFKELQVF